MPSRAFLFFNKSAAWKQAESQEKVSMPSTGIFVFQSGMAFIVIMYDMSLNATHGHFLFFNALLRALIAAGILLSQCLPTGIFVFQYTVPNGFCQTNNVSMPSTGIFVFQLSLSRSWGERVLSQCPHGHFCFSIAWSVLPRRLVLPSLNALTGIFVFQSSTSKPKPPRRPSQCPPRAFLFFNIWQELLLCHPRRSLNALTGIFVFQ